MFFFLVPPPYRPLFLLITGVVWLVLGIAVLGKISIAVGVVSIVAGIITGLGRRRSQKDNDDLDRYPSR
jgi:uncharacterized membrane protein HdeD (DUF308 family)